MKRVGKYDIIDKDFGYIDGKPGFAGPKFKGAGDIMDCRPIV